MAINRKNTTILKERFEEFFGEKPEVMNENEHGCDRVVSYTTDSINLDQLERLSEGIGNTMTISSYEGKLRISIW